MVSNSSTVMCWSWRKSAADHTHTTPIRKTALIISTICESVCLSEHGQSRASVSVSAHPPRGHDRGDSDSLSSAAHATSPR